MVTLAPEITTKTLLRLLPERMDVRESLDAYRRSGGISDSTWSLTPAQLIERIEESGLLGRGGSFYPTAKKLRSVATQPGRHVVLVNGAESEPASKKDLTLMLSAPASRSRRCASRSPRGRGRRGRCLRPRSPGQGFYRSGQARARTSWRETAETTDRRRSSGLCCWRAECRDSVGERARRKADDEATTSA